MKTFDVQSIGINKPADVVFAFISQPANLPKWTSAFKSADSSSAELVTPNGAVPIALQTITHDGHGTIDWKMTFPDGAVGMAYSRVTPDGADRAVYSFVLMAPPVPLEMLEGALGAQMEILAKELRALKGLLEA
ncbi:MAG: SRPBCC family protein [Sphingomonadales bacterium]|nr:MAG: SRPBCC family protein [Sphingomonadales bacterium]